MLLIMGVCMGIISSFLLRKGVSGGRLVILRPPITGVTVLRSHLSISTLDIGGGCSKSNSKEMFPLLTY
jgi:hypothetical protein